MLLLSAISVLAKDTSQPSFVLVLDPGHGGKDIGAPGANRKTTESAVVLDVAKRVGEMVENSGLDIKTIYTRKTDRFVTLQGRADIANKAHGDLFVSIHCNSVKSGGSRVQGTSVYTLGSGKSDENLRVAMRENSVMELEADYTTRYSGFDPNSVESYILFELSQDVHIRQSIDFARLAQTELVTTGGRADKHLRQANFWVLWATSMPAVLVELDFICNPDIEDFLASESGRDKCATAIFNAIQKYYKKIIRQRQAGKQSSGNTASAASTKRNK